MIRALLVDDEPLARAHLAMMLAAHPHIAIVGEAGTLEGARALLRTTRYDLVFLDIHLPDGTGFDLLPSVRAGARIVVATGHRQHAVRAFEVNAVDYLVKPLQPARLAEALRRIECAAGVTETTSALTGLVQFTAGSAPHVMPAANIVAIAAQENYSLLHLADGTRQLVRRTLKAWAAQLPAEHFVRASRTMLVQLNRIVRCQRHGPKAMSLQLAGLAKPIIVSRRAWTELRTRLAGETLRQPRRSA